MNQTSLVILVVLGLLALGLLLGLGYWWYRRNKPINTFVGIDFGANSVQPRRIKNLFGPFKFKRNDKTVVHFPVPQGYAISRQDGRGTLFFGDLATGQLFKPQRTADSLELDFVHGIFVEKALSDGRVQKIVESTKGQIGLKLEHIAIGLAIIAGLVIINIYQFAQA